MPQSLNSKIVIPEFTLRHLYTLTDDKGIMQHSLGAVPNPEFGYTTDDNARALVAVGEYYRLTRLNKYLSLVCIYLDFLCRAQKKDGGFYNLMRYDNNFCDSLDSEDCIGRVLWGCGYIIYAVAKPDIQFTARKLFNLARVKLSNFKFIRAIACAIIGLYYYLKVVTGDRELFGEFVRLADMLVAQYNNCASEDWRWFENELTYDNGRLPYALFLAYNLTQEFRYLDIAKKTTDFLNSVLFRDGILQVIGNKGWYQRGKKPALYDQQPIDAACMVELNVTAFQTCHDELYKELARVAFAWFLGKNQIEFSLYAPKSGGCKDGFSQKEVNINQGAESTISYLIARLMIKELESDAERL